MVNATVTVKRTFPLNCADKASLRILDSPVLLGPLDQISLAFVPITVVYVYRHERPSDKELIPLTRLRCALARLLDYYPHLTGRIVINSNDHTAQIEELGAGGKLVSAQCDQPLKAFEAVSDDDEPGSSPRLIAANLPDGGNALMPSFDSTEEGLNRDAILTVQHTRFICGAVAIGVRIRHIICDAAGFFQLAGDLAEIYRRQSSSVDTVTLSSMPHFSSYVTGQHEMSLEEREDALKTHPFGFELAQEVKTEASMTADDTPPPLVTGRLLRFSSDELAAIKAEANTGSKDRQLSTFSSLTAHLYQCVYRARVRLCKTNGIDVSEAMHHVPRQFLTSVNSRIQLGVPPRYFPNCLFCPVFSLTADQLQDGSLSSIATAVYDGIQVPDQSELRQSLRWIAAQPDKRRIQLNFHYEKGGFLMSQWNKFGMYRGAVFDVPPVLVTQPFTPINLVDGLVYIMGTEDELSQSADSVGITTGSLDVAMALSEALWAALDQDKRLHRHRRW